MRQSETRRLRYCQSCWLNSGWLRICREHVGRPASDCPSRACRSRRKCPWRSARARNVSTHCGNGCAADLRKGGSAERKRGCAGRARFSAECRRANSIRAVSSAESWRGYCRRRPADLLWLRQRQSEEPMFDHPIARRSGHRRGRGGHRCRPRRRGERAGQARDPGERILGEQGEREALPLPQARRAEAGRARSRCCSWCTARRTPTRSSYDLNIPGKGILADERHGRLWLRRVDHGPRRLRPFRFVRQQFRHRERRRGSEGRDPGRGAGERPAEGAHVRHVVGRDPRRRLRAGGSPSGSTG